MQRCARPGRCHGRGDRDRGGRDASRPRGARTSAPTTRTGAGAAAQQRARGEQARGELATIRDAARLCDALDALTADSPDAQRAALVQQFDALTLPSDAQAALQARFAAARDPELALPLEAGEGANDVSASAAELTVRAELAAGIETRAEARELRRRGRSGARRTLGGAASTSGATPQMSCAPAVAFAGLLAWRQHNARRSRHVSMQHSMRRERHGRLEARPRRIFPCRGATVAPVEAESRARSSRRSFASPQDRLSRSRACGSRRRPRPAFSIRPSHERSIGGPPAKPRIDRRMPSGIR